MYQFLQLSTIFTEKGFWERVKDAFIRQPEVGSHREKRSIYSLKSRFGYISKVAQKYLQADKLYRSQRPSGETEEDTQEAVMKLYQHRNKEKKNGKIREPPVIKFLDAVFLLSECPKWSGKVGGSSREALGYRYGASSSNSGLETGSSNAMHAGIVPSFKPSQSRPTGIKKTKSKMYEDCDKDRIIHAIQEMNNVHQLALKGNDDAQLYRLQIHAVSQMRLSDEDRNRRIQRIIDSLEMKVSMKPPTREEVNRMDAVVRGGQSDLDVDVHSREHVHHISSGSNESDEYVEMTPPEHLSTNLRSNTAMPPMRTEAVTPQPTSGLSARRNTIDLEDDAAAMCLAQMKEYWGQ